MNDIVIPSTAKQIQTQKILHEYRDRMLGENLRSAVATIDPDILQSEIAKFVNKDCRMIEHPRGNYVCIAVCLK